MIMKSPEPLKELPEMEIEKFPEVTIESFPEVNIESFPVANDDEEKPIKKGMHKTPL